MRGRTTVENIRKYIIKYFFFIRCTVVQRRFVFFFHIFLVFFALFQIKKKKSTVEINVFNKKKSMATFKDKWKNAVSNSSTGKLDTCSSLATGSCISTKSESGWFTKRNLYLGAMAMVVAYVAYRAYLYYQEWKDKKEKDLRQVELDDSKHNSTEWGDFFAAEQQPLEQLDSDEDNDEPTTAPPPPPDDPKFTKLSSN